MRASVVRCDRPAIDCPRQDRDGGRNKARISSERHDSVRLDRRWGNGVQVWVVVRAESGGGGGDEDDNDDGEIESDTATCGRGVRSYPRTMHARYKMEAVCGRSKVSSRSTTFHLLSYRLDCLSLYLVINR